MIGSALRGAAQELDEEANRSDQRDLVGHLGLHDAIARGREPLLANHGLEDTEHELALEHLDPSPDAGLRRVAMEQAAGNRRLVEDRRSAIGFQIRRQIRRQIRSQLRQGGRRSFGVGQRRRPP
jgi:hypothetical protein